MHATVSPPDGCLRERNGSPAIVVAGDSIQLRCEPWSEVVEVERVFWMQCKGRKHERKQNSLAAVELKIEKRRWVAVKLKENSEHITANAMLRDKGAHL